MDTATARQPVNLLMVLALSFFVWSPVTPAAVILPFPVTNNLPATKVIVAQPDPNKLRLKIVAAPIEGDSLGWMTWQLSIQDGKRKPLTKTVYQQAFLDFPESFDPNKPARIELNGTEYIPSEKLAVPNAGEATAISVSPRGRAFGAERLYLLGPGTYRLENGIIVSRKTSAKNNSLEMNGEDILDVSTHDVSVLLAQNPRKTGVFLTPRVRERPQRGLGSALSASPRTPVSMPGSNGLIYQLFIFKYPSRMPLSTNQVEVELIARLPGQDIRIQPPSSL